MAQAQQKIILRDDTEVNKFEAAALMILLKTIQERTGGQDLLKAFSLMSQGKESEADPKAVTELKKYRLLIDSKTQQLKPLAAALIKNSMRETKEGVVLVSPYKDGREGDITETKFLRGMADDFRLPDDSGRK